MFVGPALHNCTFRALDPGLPQAVQRNLGRINFHPVERERLKSMAPR